METSFPWGIVCTTWSAKAPKRSLGKPHLIVNISKPWPISLLQWKWGIHCLWMLMQNRGNCHFFPSLYSYIQCYFSLLFNNSNGNYNNVSCSFSRWLELVVHLFDCFIFDFYFRVVHSVVWFWAKPRTKLCGLVPGFCEPNWTLDISLVLVENHGSFPKQPVSLYDVETIKQIYIYILSCPLDAYFDLSLWCGF